MHSYKIDILFIIDIEQERKYYGNSNVEIQNQTHYPELNKEDGDFPLGADADTMNRTKSRSNEYQEDRDDKNSGIVDDSPSFREPAPSTAISTCSNVSTGQLIPTSGKFEST